MRCSAHFFAGIWITGKWTSPAFSQTTIIHFEFAPGPDGIWGISDDIQINAPTSLPNQMVQLSDEYQALGLLFTPNNPTVDGRNEVLDTANFTTPPGHSIPNILAASGQNSIQAEFSLPVLRVAAIIGIGAGADEMEIYDAAGNSLGSVIGDDSMETLTSPIPIARVVVRPATFDIPAMDNFQYMVETTIGTPFCNPGDLNSTGQPTQN